MKIVAKNVGFLTGAAASLLMGATELHAGNILGTVQMNTYGGVYPGNGGGEFTAVTQTGPSYLGYYNALDATYAGGFETFCVETGVDFSGGSSYYYSLGSVAQPVGNLSYPPSTGAGVNLSAGAAWLYAEFGRGVLANFEWNYDSTRQSDDNLLQAAIWTFQGNQNYTSAYTTPATQANNVYYDAAVNALGSTNAANANYTGTSVEILQMWTGEDANGNGIGPAQNQLVLVPDGGMTAGLLGIGLIGFGALRRKLGC